MKRARAFTLIELLTVIAITAVLMTLIVLPLFQSFQVLRQGQALADAQDKARLLVDRIAREVGNAVTVRGGASTVGATVNPVDATTPAIGLPTSSLVIQVPKKGGGTIETILPEAKMDLVPPARGETEKDASGAIVFRNPITGKIDPTMTRPAGDVNLSARPGPTIVRYWIGLRDPQQPYNEPYTGLLTTRDTSRDNLYVLRRAEVQPYLASGAVNTAFFKADPNDPKKIVDMDDPRFFVRDGHYSDPNNATNPGAWTSDPDSLTGKDKRVENWTAASVIQTEVSRYDMIRVITTGSASTPSPTYVQGTDVPVVVPLIRFRPTRVSSAPAEGGMVARPGMAADGLENVGPEVYQTDRGLWSNAITRHYPGGYNPSDADLTLRRMEVAVSSGAGAAGIFHGAVDPSGSGFENIHPNNFELFDLKVYEGALASGQPYAFTMAATAADQRDLRFPVPGRLWTPDAEERATFMPFRLLAGTGKIVTSFPIEQVGRTALANGPRPNLPTQPVSADDPPTGTGANNIASGAALSPRTAGYDPNLAFNRIFNGDPLPTGTPQNILLQAAARRFIDLRMVPNEDGTLSPLYPTPISGQVTGFNSVVQTSKTSTGADVADSGGRMNRVRIVPGSEAVYAPDQTTTGGYRFVVRYTRVASNPGPNQYRIVYADLPEPTNDSGAVDYSVLGLGLNTATFDPQTYDPTNLVSAVIQPRYKAGYLEFCSDPNVPLPIGPNNTPGMIQVSYRFQFNGPKDTFAVDFDTREVMQILLTIKNYPQSSAPNPQQVTLKSTATLRNALR